MISLLEDREIIAALSEEQVFGTRIYADFLSGASELIWWDGERLLIGLKNSVMSLCGEVNDREELNGFIAMLGPQVIMCGEDTAELIDRPVIQSGIIMRRFSQGERAEISPIYPETPLAEYYKLLESCDMAPDFGGFCRETSKALSSGTGLIIDEWAGDRLTAALIAASVTESSAIINAVAVRPDFQRKGIGRRLLEFADGKLRGRELYILREEEKNEKFYTACGYENSGRWCVLSDIGDR